MSEDDFPDALPPGHRLHWYLLEQVLGQGGFGITYLARDTNLDRPVAIKEYLPADVARRRSDASARPRTESHAERFAWGLDRFLAEARTLARFDHPNIVRVLSIFEANSTAYMVMRFEEGEDLGTLLDRRGTLPQRELVDFLLPVLGGLQLIHSSGFIHRDIKPENIYIRDDGSPVLLDFGSARQSFGNAKTMTILVAPGYAPLEQYYGDAKTQGPWTDIYGLAATCYRAITGRAPLDAVARAKGVLGSTRDLLEPAATVAGDHYDERLLAAIDHALQLGERDRPQNIAEWRREIVLPIEPAMNSAAVESRPVNQLTGPTADHPSEPTPTRSPTAAAQASPQGSDVSDRPAATVLRNAMTGRQWAMTLGLFAAAAVAIFALRAMTMPPSAVATPAPLASAANAAVPLPPTETIAATASAPLTGAVSSNLAGGPPASPPTVPTPSLTEPARVKSTANNANTVDAKPEVRAGVTKSPTLRAVEVPATTAPLSRPNASFTRPAATTPLAEAAPRSVVATSVAARPVLPASQLAAAGAASVATSVAVTSVPSVPPSTTSSTRRRDDQLEAAESALRRGDAAGAAQIATPWAAAGVARAQTLLGRAQESRSNEKRNDFEAYVWYGIAARNGEAAAQALKEKVAGRLQPAEVRQADQIIDGWKPRGEAAPDSATERRVP